MIVEHCKYYQMKWKLIQQNDQRLKEAISSWNKRYHNQCQITLGKKVVQKSCNRIRLRKSNFIIYAGTTVKIYNETQTDSELTPCMLVAEQSLNLNVVN